MAMKIPTLIGNEIVQGAPEMTFEEARVAVLQAASQLQGLLTIYPALEKAAIAEKEIKSLEIYKQELKAESEAIQLRQEVQQNTFVAQHQREEDAFRERIDKYKVEIVGLLDKIKDVEAASERAKTKAQEYVTSFTQEFEMQKLDANNELQTLLGQVAETEKQLKSLKADKARIIAKYKEE